MPGTQPFTSSALDLTSKPPPCLGPNSTVQLVSTFFGGLPPLARPLESAMLKQLACAAASSSSGVVWFGAPSVRALQLRFASLNVPLCALVRPLPDMRSQSGTFKDANLSWRARTEGAPNHTTPEELLAAAHASCFSMALSNGLAKGGNPPKKVETNCTVEFGPKQGGGFEVKSSALEG